MTKGHGNDEFVRYLYSCLCLEIIIYVTVFYLFSQDMLSVNGTVVLNMIKVRAWILIF